MPTVPALRATGLVKNYRRGRAVDGVDLTVAPGERVALLGPNGAGKTTTLLMCLGAVAPDAGTVEILGHRLPGERSRAMARVGFGAGYLPLPERVRVIEYLRMFGRLANLRRPDRAAQAALERFGIPHLARSMGTELSSGQKTLVGIAKAILHRPQLLVLDEPTASLDPDVALRVRTGLHDISADHGTALLVTSHNMVEVERLCQRVVFLSAGRVVADGTAGQITERFGRSDLEQVFLHLAAAHTADAAHKADKHATETHTAEAPAGEAHTTEAHAAEARMTEPRMTETRMAGEHDRSGMRAA